jgi:RNA polymerase-binding transcription factor DksA
MSDETAATVGQLGEIEQRLSDVDSALQRLDQGRYGKCQSCGGSISDDQLARNPAVQLCADCQSAAAGAAAADEVRTTAAGAGQRADEWGDEAALADSKSDPGDC